MIKYEIPASVQASILSIATRKVIQRPPEKQSVLGCLVYPFTLSRDSQALVAKELNPKRPFLPDKDSLLDLDHGIQGDIINGFSTRHLRPPKQPKKFSSAHRGRQFNTAEGKNFAELGRMYRALKQMLPELPPLLESSK